MALLISESLALDAVLDRAIPWRDDVYDYLASLTAEDEVQEHEGRIASGSDPSWYDLRLSALRQAILDAS
jgi:hypothetical protein